MSAGRFASLGALTRESFADATRRRIVPVIAVLSLVSLLGVDSCTSCATGELMVDGQVTQLTELASFAGAFIFVSLALWTMILAGVVASDHLSHPLADGSAALVLSRPVSRDTFALSRLLGAIAISWATGAVLLGGTAFLLLVRSGISPIPALWGALACAAGSFTIACLSMASSLWLPQVVTVLMLFTSVGVVATVNLAAQSGLELAGGPLAIDRFGPPLATAVLAPLAPWVEPGQIAAEPLDLVLRSSLWCLASLALLLGSFRRLELGR